MPGAAICLKDILANDASPGTPESRTRLQVATRAFVRQALASKDLVAACTTVCLIPSSELRLADVAPLVRAAGASGAGRRLLGLLEWARGSATLANMGAVARAGLQARLEALSPAAAQLARSVEAGAGAVAV